MKKYKDIKFEKVSHIVVEENLCFAVRLRDINEEVYLSDKLFISGFCAVRETARRHMYEWEIDYDLFIFDSGDEKVDFIKSFKFE